MVEDEDRHEGHGHKRRATDELERDQRLAKRFDLLNLANDSKLYVPVSASAHDKPSNPNPQPDASNNELMEVEDTSDRVYIYDLDKELAESESDDERPIFIPDIEKHLLARIPRHILIGDDAREAVKNMQMILYQAPTSLTVAPEKDNVRRAIIEARKRAQETQALRIPPIIGNPISNSTNGFNQGISESNGEGLKSGMVEVGADAMDMD